jgi:DNA-binding CsgD family transcriptional regulator
LTVAPKQTIPAVLFAADVRVPGNTRPHDILVVATAAEGTIRVRVQVQETPSSGDWAAENDAEPGVRAVGRGARRARTAGGLTGRELEIMLLVAGGKTSRQIGEALFISPRTVEMHVQGSLLKLGCRTRAEAVRRLAELGTLPPVGTTR